MTRKLRAFRNLLILLLLVSCHASVPEGGLDPHVLGYEQASLGVVDSGATLKELIGRKASSILIEQSLVPGAPVDAWKQRSQSARDEGSRLPDRITVARMVVRYEDGRECAANIRYGESVGSLRRDWWNPVDGFIHDLAFADISWTAPLRDDSLEHAVVYRMHWPNPRPEVSIESVRIEPGEGLGRGRLLVYGVETEHRPSRGETYFVATNGDDDAPGTWDNPWASLHAAAERIRPGDAVYVRGGVYRPTKRIAFKYLDASEDQRTRIIGWPGETADFNFKDAHWDTSAERRNLGFEFYPHDQSMIMAYDCDYFTFKNLHLSYSRARGFGMDTGWAHYGFKPEHLRDGGKPEQVNETYVEGGEILYCSVYMVFSAGIRFSNVNNGRLIGNILMRPETIAMGPAEAETAGYGPLAGVDATTFVNRNGERKRNPPMEGIDCGKFSNIEMAYNEICWSDKECSLIDGNVEGLRVHHNYVHNAWNLPWVAGIGVNGYGRQRNVEIDHNIAHHVGSAFSVGTEGGGQGKNIRVHHNITWDCHWTGGGIAGAWKNDASLQDVSMYNNTHFHNGHYDRNPRIPWREIKGPAGGIPVAFPADSGWTGRGNPRRPISGAVTDVVIANNLIIEPRDYALAVMREGDIEENNIRFLNNLTDLIEESELLELERNQAYRPIRGKGLVVYTERPVLRDPRRYDFRLLPDTPAVGGGVKIKDDGKPGEERTDIGAFGPDSQWVEVSTK